MSSTPDRSKMASHSSYQLELRGPALQLFAALVLLTTACGGDGAAPSSNPLGGAGAQQNGGAAAGAAPSEAGSEANDGGRDTAGGNAGGGGAAGGGAAGSFPVGGMAGAAAAGDAGQAGSAAGMSGMAGGPPGGDTIINDRFWKDTSGTPIYSQGGGMLQVGDTFYWYGVKYGGAVTYAANPTGKNDDTSFQGITTYSSKDLVSWKLEATDKPGRTGGWFGRLGVVYHAATKKYVLAAQGGGGLYFATSDKPNGGFVFDNIQTDLPGIANGSTGDQTLFQDDDGQAYLVSSSSSGRGNRYVSPLRASDFLAAEQAILVYKGGGREGNCMFKYDGHYYFCSSDLHGWNSSHTYCVSSANIKGPWSAEFVLDGTDADYSHVTQTGFFFPVKGTSQTTIVFAGDRWSDFAGNGLGYNQWMPLSFLGTTPRFHSLSAWTLNPQTGAWAVAPQNNWALNPSFEAARISVTTPVAWTSKGGSNTTGGHSGRWSWQLTGQGSSLSQNVAELPAGSYSLTVWAKSQGSGAELYAKGIGAADKSAPIPSSGTWTKVTLTGLVVSTGKAEIGVTSGGQTVTLDDFVLSASPLP